ncbi:GNAT family N-acetyltransferase [Butyrivibrio sp. AE2005]|uniref:GNAT family N-acetyltransferase n=1 Tax=Butyrivibrio sp. AE2005 TaxID=1496722 RepID=UPI00047918C8|nr:GNAT family N-acetyltransferase [Butyrivibrio sp. AE2005]
MEYRIVEDINEMKLDDIVRLLRTTYWADKRPVEKIEKSVQNSKCYGLYLEEAENLVGFARIITDYATNYYLSDVIIDEKYRNKGLGKVLVSHIVSSPELQGLRGILVTKDAQKLYSQYGFEVVDGRVMLRNP